MLEKVKKYIRSISKDHEIPHFEKTLYWLKKLKPDADETMQIAAFAHDIERVFRKENIIDKFKKIDFTDQNHVDEHQKKGAEIIKEFLQKESYDKAKTEKVYNLVLHHEDGGDPESDLIKDVDSLSYFETNVKFFCQKFAPVLGRQKIKQKFDYMYNRIISPKAKKIAEPLYQKALAELEKIK